MDLDNLSVFLPYVTALAAVLLVKKSVAYIKLKKRAYNLRKKARAKRQKEQEYIQQQIDKYEKVVRPSELKFVLKLNGPELLEEYRSGKLKPSDVLKMYLLKSCKVTKELNCITEVLKDCTQRAEEMDGKDARKLPLYGIPVSMKENYQTKGAPSAVGWAKWLDIMPEDCVVAKVLKHCGAVPFVKTNLSQMTLSFAASNPIYGETSNPHNPDFGPGGSSSGEGCIIGAGASVLGFGTDTGGSIRCPSHLCGICGFKPTQGRLSHVGMVPTLNQTAISTTVGPMARDVDTLVMAMRALCCEKMFELDPTVVPIKFNDEIYNSKKPLRIGYFDDNGYIKPVPACQRVVWMAKQALEDAGHTLVPFEVPDTEQIMYTAGKALFADGGVPLVKSLEDEDVDPRLMHAYSKWTMPRWLLKLRAAMLPRRMRQLLLAYVGGGGDTSAENYFNLKVEVEFYKQKFWAEWKEKRNLDALICPIYPIVASPKGSLVKTLGLVPYTLLFNVLNYPAGTVPVSKVTQKDIDDLENYQGHYGDEMDDHIKQVTKKSIGMPIGVQCVSSPYKEEVCLRLLKEVETLLPMKKE